MIETNFPSAKTVNMGKINAYVRYALINIPRLFRFYDEKSVPFHFYHYQGRQRSNAVMVNILINGGKNTANQSGKKQNKKKQSRIESSARKQSNA